MAYRPPSTALTDTVSFDIAETTFLNSIKPWTKEQWSTSFGTPAQNQSRNDIKTKIKSELEIIQNSYCAFCGLDLSLAYKVQREHIAPQYKHPHYIFEPENLVLACNYCNEHKGKKGTVINDTLVYATTTFNILHPHRDNFNQYLDCNFVRNELIFTIIGPERVKTQKTIDCVGLLEPHLMSQRGAIILKASLPNFGILDAMVKLIVSINRRRN